MKRLVLFFCLFFTLPVYAVQFELGTATTLLVNLIKAKATVCKIKRSFLYRRAKKEYKLFAKLYKKRL